jgi:uncharacterized protein involved in exopolysaccharide biosynthesis
MDRLYGLSVLFLGMAINTFSATPIYQGRVQLLIEPLTPNVVTFKEVIEQNDNNYDYYPTQYAILRSRTLARRTIDELKLWDHPEFGGGTGPETKTFSVSGAVRGAIRWPIGLLSGFFAREPVEAASPGAGETARQSSVIDAFLGCLSVMPVKDSRLVDVGFSSPNPVIAASAANALAKQYIDQNLEFRFLSTKEASDWLGQQLALSGRNWRERAEFSAREKGDAVALEDQNIVVAPRRPEYGTRSPPDGPKRRPLQSAQRTARSTALDTFHDPCPPSSSS